MVALFAVLLQIELRQLNEYNVGDILFWEFNFKSNYPNWVINHVPIKRGFLFKK